jgi:hypothetical protein
VAENTCKKRKRSPRLVQNPTTFRWEKAPTRRRPHTNRHLHGERDMAQMRKAMRIARNSQEP